MISTRKQNVTGILSHGTGSKHRWASSGPHRIPTDGCDPPKIHYPLGMSRGSRNVLNAFYQPSEADRACFKNGLYKAKEFPARTQLYRVVSRQHNSVTGGPWYFDPDTWSTVVQQAHNSGMALSEFARDRLAIKYSWSPQMDFLSCVELLVPAQGFFGLIAPQLRTREPGDSPFFPPRGHYSGGMASATGAMFQILIPNLFGDPHTLSSNRDKDAQLKAETHYTDWHAHHRGLPKLRARLVDHFWLHPRQVSSGSPLSILAAHENALRRA